MPIVTPVFSGVFSGAARAGAAAMTRPTRPRAAQRARAVANGKTSSPDATMLSGRSRSAVLAPRSYHRRRGGSTGLVHDVARRLVAREPVEIVGHLGDPPLDHAVGPGRGMRRHDDPGQLVERM